MRALIVPLLLVTVKASADPCAGVEPTLKKLAREVAALATHANQAAVACAFHGADAKLAARLAAEAKHVESDDQAVTKWASCTLTESGVTAPSFVATEHDGARAALSTANALCAPKQSSKASTDCSVPEAWFGRYVGILEDASSRIGDLAVACVVHGADDNGLTELAHTTRSRLKPELDHMPDVAQCRGPGMPLPQLLNTVARSAGQRVGFAFAMCSSTVRTRSRDLAAKGTLTPETLQKDPVAAAASARFLKEIYPSE